MNWLALKITPMKWVLLVMFTTSLWITCSRENADSCPPEPAEIRRTGPFKVEVIRGRNASVLFVSKADPEVEFLIARYRFNREIDIFETISELRSLSEIQGYIWIGSSSTDSNVWKVELNDETVLSYETAKENREASKRVHFWNLIQTGVLGLALLGSVISWKKVLRKVDNHVL